MSEEFDRGSSRSESARRTDDPVEARSHGARWIGLTLAPLLAAAVWLAMPAESRSADGEALLTSARI